MPSRRLVIPHSKPTIEADDTRAVGAVLVSGYLAQGSQVRNFEEEVATFLGLRGGVATSSGTAALHLALLALDIGPGDEVLIPSYTCVALLHAVRLAGARPRLVDCIPGHVNMWGQDAARQVTASTRAVILPHMFGRVAPVETFRALGVPIIENCAQAIGATSNQRPVGSFGDVTVLSFYATKMITTGEGGMLLSNSDQHLDVARDLRDYDKRENFRDRFNYKMTDIQAALGRSQLRKLPRFVERRRAIARRYDAVLGEKVSVYAGYSDEDACYRYVIHARDVDAVIREMQAHGVECARPVFRPLHQLVGGASCPHADETYRHAVSLPIYPALSDDVVVTVGRLAARLAEAQAIHA